MFLCTIHWNEKKFFFQIIVPPVIQLFPLHVVVFVEYT